MKRIVFIGSILFLLLSVLSIDNDLPNDGFVKIGFPLVFYTFSNAKMDAASGGIDILFLIIDIGICMLISMLLHFLLTKRRK